MIRFEGLFNYINRIRRRRYLSYEEDIYIMFDGHVCACQCTRHHQFEW